MKIYIGADHRGFALKASIITHLRERGYTVEDMGTDNAETSCDYPRFAEQVAMKVAADPEARGILACMSGIGHSIAANKIPGAYAALCYNTQAAELSRQHNNANILVLGSLFVAEDEIPRLIKAWLETPFEEGRHRRRVDQIRQMEQRYSGESTAAPSNES